MFRIIIIFLSLSGFAYIFGFTSSQPSFELEPDATIPSLAKKAAKFNPLDISPGQLEALSKVPLAQSQKDIRRRSEQVKRTYWNTMVDWTKDFNLGAMARVMKSFPTVVSNLFSKLSLTGNESRATSGSRGNIILKSKADTGR